MDMLPQSFGFVEKKSSDITIGGQRSASCMMQVEEQDRNLVRTWRRIRKLLTRRTLCFWNSSSGVQRLLATTTSIL
jgi:hypothetical protein